MTSAARPLTAAITDFVASHPAVGTAAVESAKKVIADSIGCIVAGAASEVTEPVLAYLARTGRQGSTPVLGTSLTVDPEAAALANGTFGHALDYDDDALLTAVHPTVAMVPALLAGGGSPDGARFIDAYAIGVEVAIKLGIGIGIDHYERGFHGTSTLGTLGPLVELDEIGVHGTDLLVERRDGGVRVGLLHGR